MWCLVLNLFLILNTDFDFVTTNYILNKNAVTWTAAQNICNVPSVGDIMYTTNRAYIKLPETFTAWTSSQSSRSDWTSFYGCLDVSVKNVTFNGIKRRLKEYFPKSPYTTECGSVFDCAFFCTRKCDYFTFFRHVCKCIYQNELKSDLVKRPVCIVPNFTKREHVYDVYSMSRSSLPIFKFETDFRIMSIQKGYTERRKHHCLARSINGTLTTNDCRSQKKFRCADGEPGYERWSTAIYNCLLKNESLSNDRSDYHDYWLGYFMYEEYKENEQCVAIQRNDIFRSLTYQFIPCSEHLSVLCNDEHNSVNTSKPVFVNHGSQCSKGSTESTFDRSLGPISTNTSRVQRPGEKNNTFVVGEIVIVNVVLFGLCVFIVTMTILRKRFTVQVCRTARQKFQRNNINQNPMVPKDRNCDIDNGKENRGVRDNYNDPWELRHNIVQLGELNQQDIIDIQMEETET